MLFITLDMLLYRILMYKFHTLKFTSKLTLLMDKMNFLHISGHTADTQCMIMLQILTSCGFFLSYHFKNHIT